MTSVGDIFLSSALPVVQVMLMAATGAIAVRKVRFSFKVLPGLHPNAPITHNMMVSVTCSRRPQTSPETASARHVHSPEVLKSLESPEQGQHEVGACCDCQLGCTVYHQALFQSVQPFC